MIPFYALGVFIGFTLSQTGHGGALAQAADARAGSPGRP